MDFPLIGRRHGGGRYNYLLEARDGRFIIITRDKKHLNNRHVPIIGRPFQLELTGVNGRV